MWIQYGVLITLEPKNKTCQPVVLTRGHKRQRVIIVTLRIHQHTKNILSISGFYFYLLFNIIVVMKPDTQTRIELLKKYYAYDEVSKTFTVSLHCEKVSDILYKEVKSVSNVPMMNDEFLNDVTGILEDIPHGYHADISLLIDDYEGYDEKVIMESFNDMLEFGRLKYNVGSKKKYYKVATLLAVGLILLFFGIFADVESWWGVFDAEKLIGELLINFLEIAGWVFCWEAVSILFLEENDEMKKGSSIISKLNRITLLDKDNKVLADEKYEQIQKHFYRSTPIRRIGSLLLLFSGFAFIGLSIMVLIKTIPTISVAFQYFKVILLLHLLWVILTFVGGFVAIKLYSGKEKYRIPTATYAFINLAFSILIIVYTSIYAIDVSLIVINIISGIIEIAYILGFFLTLNYKKKE